MHLNLHHGVRCFDLCRRQIQRIDAVVVCEKRIREVISDVVYLERQAVCSYMQRRSRTFHACTQIINLYMAHIQILQPYPRFLEGSVFRELRQYGFWVLFVDIHQHLRVIDSHFVDSQMAVFEQLHIVDAPDREGGDVHRETWGTFIRLFVLQRQTVRAERNIFHDSRPAQQVQIHASD